MRIIKTYVYKRKNIKKSYDIFYNENMEQEIIDCYYKEVKSLYIKKRPFTL